MTVGGGGVLNCAVDYILQEFYIVSDQIQILQNCFTTLNKMTSKDDIKGLVSLKFLRPWVRETQGFQGDKAEIHSAVCTLSV